MAAPTFTAQTALARADAPGFLGQAGLLSFGRGHAGIVGGLRRFGELGFEFRDASCQGLNPRPKRVDQRVFFSVAQVAEVGKLGHA